jgi:hypothetical protein
LPQPQFITLAVIPIIQTITLNVTKTVIAPTHVRVLLKAEFALTTNVNAKLHPLVSVLLLYQITVSI